MAWRGFYDRKAENKAQLVARQAKEREQLEGGDVMRKATEERHQRETAELERGAKREAANLARDLAKRKKLEQQPPRQERGRDPARDSARDTGRGRSIWEERMKRKKRDENAPP